MAKILRGALKTLPTTVNQGYQAPFSLSCQKVVLHYCDKWASSNGMRSFLANNAFNLANQYPSVEFVVRKRPNKHPNIKGCFGKSYIPPLQPCGLTFHGTGNGRDKVICVRNMKPSEIKEKMSIVLDSSGRKMRQMDRYPVESVNPSVRGIWSPFHEQ